MADLISREELFKEMRQFMFAIMHHENPAQRRDPNWNDAISLVGSARAVDAVPVVHGRWKLVGWHKGLKVMECSICKNRAFGSTDYCPNCIAKMDGERRYNDGIDKGED